MKISIDLEWTLDVSVFHVFYITHIQTHSSSISIGSICNFLENINLENRFKSTFRPRYTVPCMCMRVFARFNAFKMDFFIDFILFSLIEIHWNILIINEMKIHCDGNPVFAFADAHTYKNEMIYYTFNYHKQIERERGRCACLCAFPFLHCQKFYHHFSRILLFKIGSDHLFFFFCLLVCHSFI